MPSVVSSGALDISLIHTSGLKSVLGDEQKNDELVSNGLLQGNLDVIKKGEISAYELEDESDKWDLGVPSRKEMFSEDLDSQGSNASVSRELFFFLFFIL